MTTIILTVATVIACNSFHCTSSDEVVSTYQNGVVTWTVSANQLK